MSILVPTEMAERVDQLATRSGGSRSAITRLALEAFFESVALNGGIIVKIPVESADRPTPTAA